MCLISQSVFPVIPAQAGIQDEKIAGYPPSLKLWRATQRAALLYRGKMPLPLFAIVVAQKCETAPESASGGTPETINGWVLLFKGEYFDFFRQIFESK
jgi:hypothetical protein